MVGHMEDELRAHGFGVQVEFAEVFFLSVSELERVAEVHIHPSFLSAATDFNLFFNQVITSFESQSCFSSDSYWLVARQIQLYLV